MGSRGDQRLGARTGERRSSDRLWRRTRASVLLITAGLRTPWPRESPATPGITGIRTGIRPSLRRPRSKLRCVMVRLTRRTKTGMIWMPTVTGIPTTAGATCGFPPASVRGGTPTGPATGATTPPLATPGFRAIRGAGCLTIAASGTTTPSVGDGLRAAAEGSGVR